MATKVRFLKDSYSLDGEMTTDLTIGRVYDVLSTDDCGTVNIFDDVGDASELYRGEYELVEDLV